jgi:DNA mismatch endonuclease (patch repair protein)
MQANKSKNTKPELLVRARLREAGCTGYRLHWKKAPGKPDICFPGRRVAIFVNGCFWHRCPHCALPLPKTNVEFWKAKFERNRARDSRDNALLVQDGWTVIVVWECMLKKERLEPTMQEVLRELDRASGDAPRVPHVVEIGSARPWMLRRERQKLRSRYALR